MQRTKVQGEFLDAERKETLTRVQGSLVLSCGLVANQRNVRRRKAAERGA